MAIGTKDAVLAQALEKHQLGYAKRGLVFGILSGMTWGLQGVLLWSLALYFGPFGTPYSYSPLWGGLIAAVTIACLHDFIASAWILLMDGITGRLKEIPRALKTRPGRLAIFACIFGGPIGMGGYVIGMYLAGVTYALAISAIYPAVGALLGRIVLKERIIPRVWIGIIACLIGAVFVGWAPPAVASPYFYLGIVMSFLPAIGWGAEGVISTYGMDMIDPDIAIWIREFFSGAIAFFTTVLGVSIAAAAATGGVEIMTSWDVDAAGNLLPLLDEAGNQVTMAISALSGWKMLFAAFTDFNAILWVALAACAGGFSYVFWYRALNMIGCGRAMAFNVTYALWSVPFGYLANFITRLYGWENGYAASGTILIGVVIITVGTILVVVNPKELLNMRDV